MFENKRVADRLNWIHINPKSRLLICKEILYYAFWTDGNGLRKSHNFCCRCSICMK